MRTAVFSRIALSCLRSRKRDRDEEPGISTLHFLEKVLATPECNAHKALQANGLQTQALLDMLTRFRDRAPGVEPAVRTMMTHALEIAEEQRKDTVGTDHLLLALLGSEDSRAGYVLKQLGLNADAIESWARKLPGER